MAEKRLRLENLGDCGLTRLNYSSHQRHNLTPQTFDLFFEETDGVYQMRIVLKFKENTDEGKPRQSFQRIILPKDYNLAFKRYLQYREKMIDGKYNLHTFDDGTLEVELK
jgi:hypothetical protein